MKGHPPDCFCEFCRGEDAISQPPPWNDSETTSAATAQQLSAITELIESELRQVQAYLSEHITKILKGEKMLPQAGSSSAPASNTGKKGRMNWLTQEMLSKTPKPARIIAVRYEPEHRFGASVVLKLAMDGQTIFWTLNIKKNPNYEWLTEEFGHDENAWPDKEILLYLEEDKFNGQLQVRVDFPKQEEQEDPPKQERKRK